MSERLNLGRFEWRPVERLLLADGEPVVLGMRAVDVLAVLIEHRERLVTKQELLDLVWPGLVVEENNLQVQVSNLRRVLGARAIATIPGRGYRFTLAVSEREGGLAAPVVVPAAPGTAPARASVGAGLTTAQPAPALPHRLSPLIGRDAELAELRALCAAQSLVSLVGASGMGKTRLAQQLAAERAEADAEAVAWVEAAPLRDAGLLPGALAAALGLQLAPGGDPLAAVVAALKPLATLVVLDNAEHLLEGAARLAQALLDGTPHVRLLVTSQAPLRLDREAVYRLDALAVPPPGTGPEEALRFGAVALLVDRARAADRRFAIDDGNVAPVIDICRRLDGVALALQLAAARLPLLGARALAQGLDARFALLRAGSRAAEARHGTLQAALDWSHELLSADEQAVFRRLGVCAGVFTLDLAAEVAVVLPPDRPLGTPPAVAEARSLERWDMIERLATLVERSLVSLVPASGDDPPRYALSETGRAYALEQLARAGELEAMRARHARALRRRFEAAPNEWLAMSDAAWLARYEPELDDLRAALDWALEHDGETAIALVGAAAPLWHHLSLDAEARHWHAATESLLSGSRQAALPSPLGVGGAPQAGVPAEPDGVDAAVPKALAAQWWRGAQWAWAEVDPERSRAAAQHAHRLYRERVDAHGLYAQLSGEAGMWKEPHPRARAALDAALQIERPDWPPRERAWGQRARADVARAEGRLADSRAAREAELALRIEAGDERGRQRALAHLADLALALGEVDEAVRRGWELVEPLRRQRRSSTLCTAMLNLLDALLVQGDVAAAASLAPEAAALACDCGLLWLAADDLAWLAALQGRFDTAGRLAGWADAAYASRGDVRSTTRLAARERTRVVLIEALGVPALARLLEQGARDDAAHAAVLAAGAGSAVATC